MINYKIVKYKNWEKEKTYSYDVHCTFAHGDTDLHKKNGNLYMSNTAPSMIPYDMSSMER